MLQLPIGQSAPDGGRLMHRDLTASVMQSQRKRDAQRKYDIDAIPRAQQPRILNVQRLRMRNVYITFYVAKCASLRE